MTSFIKRLFGMAEADLDNILASFHRTLDDLKAHITHHKQAAAYHTQAVQIHTQAADTHTGAADKAATIAKNIGELIGHTPEM